MTSRAFRAGSGSMATIPCIDHENAEADVDANTRQTTIHRDPATAVGCVRAPRRHRTIEANAMMNGVTTIVAGCEKAATATPPTPSKPNETCDRSCVAREFLRVTSTMDNTATINASSPSDAPSPVRLICRCHVEIARRPPAPMPDTRDPVSLDASTPNGATVSAPASAAGRRTASVEGPMIAVNGTAASVKRGKP